MENVTPEVDNATPETSEVELQGQENIEVDSGETKESVLSIEESKNWYEKLDPDLKNNPSIQKFKDPASLAKSYVELQKMVGKDKVVLPTSKSTPAEWEAFYEKIGRPKDINEYSVPEIEVPDEVKMRQRRSRHLSRRRMSWVLQRNKLLSFMRSRPRWAIKHSLSRSRWPKD